MGSISAESTNAAMPGCAGRRAWRGSKDLSENLSTQRWKFWKTASGTWWMWKRDRKPDFSWIRKITGRRSILSAGGKKVLDCFTHTGSFALNAGIAGADSVLGVDASQVAIEQAEENARLNHLEEKVRFQCADVFELLPELERAGEKYDVVILDPPAFTKSRSSVKNAVKGYREINLRGLKLVRDGGFLVTCSCSHFMEPELFSKTLREAAAGAHKRLRQVEFRTQACDHPILWAADQTYYLKFYIFQVCGER